MNTDNLPTTTSARPRTLAFVLQSPRQAGHLTRQFLALICGLLILLLSACNPISVPSVPTIDEEPIQGTAGLGDSLFPVLGNGGYDVQHYTLDLQVDPATNVITGTATISALATETLETFNLDFHGLTVDAVTVDGMPGAFKRMGDELILSPATPLPRDLPFTTTVAYHGQPSPLADPAIEFSTLGWQHKDDVIYTINEPSGAMNWFPSNNHPLDKATYTIRVTVPATLTAASNGALSEIIDNGDTSTFVWEMRQPMASYLAAIYIGDFTRVEQAGPDGLALRYYVPTAETERLLKVFDAVPEMLRFYTDAFGPYPFDTYGAIVMPFDLGYAMENQTMNLFGLDSSVELVIAHELMHEWFGNNVSLSDWQDIWLNEGFAYYIPFLWAESARGMNLDPMMESFYRQVDNFGSVGSATVGADEMFGASVYQRGALTLHALRKLVGAETFDEILRTYYMRYAGGNATTADFIAVADEVSGQKLADFFHSWLYEDELPPLTGDNR